MRISVTVTVGFLKGRRFSFRVPVVGSSSLRRSLCRRKHKEFLSCAREKPRARHVSKSIVKVSISFNIKTSSNNCLLNARKMNPVNATTQGMPDLKKIDELLDQKSFLTLGNTNEKIW